MGLGLGSGSGSGLGLAPRAARRASSRRRCDRRRGGRGSTRASASRAAARAAACNRGTTGCSLAELALQLARLRRLAHAAAEARAPPAVPLPTLLSDRPRGMLTGPRQGHVRQGRACANQQPGSKAHGQPRSSRADAVRLAVAQQHDRLDVDAYTLGARVQARIRERAHGPRQRVRLVSRAGAEIGQRAPWLQSRRRVRWRPRRPSLRRRRWRQYEWRRRPACSKRIYSKRGWWRGIAPARPPASGIAAGAGLDGSVGKRMTRSEAAWALQRPWPSTRGVLKSRCRGASQLAVTLPPAAPRNQQQEDKTRTGGLQYEVLIRVAKSIALMRGSKGGPCSNCVRRVTFAQLME